jgi:hypothetical protein
MFTCVIIKIDDKYNIKNVRCVNRSNNSTWLLLAWWLLLQFGLSYMCNPYVGVSFMQVSWELSASHTTNSLCVCVCLYIYIYIYIYVCNLRIILLPVTLTSIKLTYLCILWTPDRRIAHTYQQFVLPPLKKGWSIQQWKSLVPYHQTLQNCWTTNNN